MEKNRTKKEEALKKATLKWLNHLSDELLNISLSYSLSKEDKIQNDKDSKEIDNCIQWIKTK